MTNITTIFETSSHFDYFMIMTIQKQRAVEGYVPPKTTWL